MYTPFAVTVDIVLLTVTDTFELMVVKRGVDPYRDQLALPGGFVRPDESIDAAAHRELAEETGMVISDLPGVHLEQLATFGVVSRDPRMRVVSVAYLGLSRTRPLPEAGTDAAEARWLPVDETPSTGLAFDHDSIVATGIERARAKLEYTTLAAKIAGDDFTLGDLHHIYETVWNVDLNLANFRRKVLATDGFVVPTGAKRVSNSGGAPATVYRAGTATHLTPPIVRPGS